MAEKIVLDVEIETGGSKRTLGQLEEQAEMLNEELRKVPLGTKAFKDLQGQLIGVNKEIKNTELSMEALDNEQVASELGSVAGAVGDMTAAFVLLGGTGGALEETAQNIEKALGISMAFKGAIEGVSSARKLFNNLLKQSNVLQHINNTATQIAEGVYGQFSSSVDVTSKSFKTLRGAIIATGIGALVVAVGYLIANFDKLKTAINGVSAEQKDLLATAKKDLEISKKKLDAISQQENILKLQGKTEREILKLKIAQIKVAIEDQRLILETQEKQKQAQIEAAARNKQILSGIISVISIPLTLLLKSIDDITAQLSKVGLMDEATKLLEGFTKGTASLLFDPEETKQNVETTIEETKTGLTALENELAGFQLSVREMDKTTAEAKKKANDEVNEDAIKAAKSRNAQILDSENELLQNVETIRFDSNGRIIEGQKAFWETMGQLSAEASEKERLRRQKELEDFFALEEAKLNISSNFIGALISINEGFSRDDEESKKKAFDRNKKLQIAQALISTYQGANAIFASAAANPSTVLFPAQPFIAAALAIASGLGNVAQISKQQYQSSSKGGTDSVPNFGGTGGDAIPGLNPVTNTSTLVPQGDTKVFVTETDISNTQNKVSVIEDQATIN